MQQDVFRRYCNDTIKKFQVFEFKLKDKESYVRKLWERLRSSTPDNVAQQLSNMAKYTEDLEGVIQRQNAELAVDILTLERADELCNTNLEMHHQIRSLCYSLSQLWYDFIEGNSNIHNFPLFLVHFRQILNITGEILYN